MRREIYNLLKKACTFSTGTEGRELDVQSNSPLNECLEESPREVALLQDRDSQTDGRLGVTGPFTEVPNFHSRLSLPQAQAQLVIFGDESAVPQN